MRGRDPEGSRDGEEVGGVEGRDTIGIYCIKRESMFRTLVYCVLNLRLLSCGG